MIRNLRIVITLNPILGVSIKVKQEGEDNFREASRKVSEVIMKGRNQSYFKACPKCRGDMYLDEDSYGVFTKCLQCGRIFESPVSQPKLGKVGSAKMAA
jgi:hypothetical protein